MTENSPNKHGSLNQAALQKHPKSEAIFQADSSGGQRREAGGRDEPRRSTLIIQRRKPGRPSPCCHALIRSEIGAVSFTK